MRGFYFYPPCLAPAARWGWEEGTEIQTAELPVACGPVGERDSGGGGLQWLRSIVVLASQRILLGDFMGA